MLLAISKAEILQRQQTFFAKVQEKQLDCAILFGVTDIFI